MSLLTHPIYADINGVIEHVHALINTGDSKRVREREGMIDRYIEKGKEERVGEKRERSRQRE